MKGGEKKGRIHTKCSENDDGTHFQGLKDRGKIRQMSSG